MNIAGTTPIVPAERGIFCNRTLNLRAIRAIGYDMDYTLIHYRVDRWEQAAYERTKEKFAERGWPVDELRFDPQLMVRGLIIDKELGNVVKANRFGYVKRAFHGTRPIAFEVQRRLYARTIVDLADRRWAFLNTLFSLSEACLYAQLVELLDQGRAPVPMGYADLYHQVRASIDQAHMEGQLKAAIAADPDRFVELDPELPLALLDQRYAGKRLMLITNSGWEYTDPIMSYAFDRFLPAGTTWRDLFAVIIVDARKPSFFTDQSPLFQVMDGQGMLRPCTGGLEDGAVYLGGNAALVEEYLGLSGDEILYVGDHIFGDVQITKSVLRWRTALILRELEAEMAAVEAFRPRQARLQALMDRKEEMEAEYCHLRLQLQRQKNGYGPHVAVAVGEAQQRLAELREAIAALDGEIGPLAQAADAAPNPNWGLLMRTGNDKSHLARQVERYADIYTSRVSNFLYATPFVYLRSPKGSLPHDPVVAALPSSSERAVAREE